MAWGCLLLLYKNYIVSRIVYMFVWSGLGFAITSPSFVAPLLLVSEIARYIAWGCLLLFYKNYIVYYNVDCYYLVCSLKSMCIPSFVFVVPIYIPSVVYGLRLFIVVVQELHCLSNCLHVCMIRVRVCYHFTKFCCSTPEIAKYIA